MSRTPVRYPSGVANAFPNELLGNFGLLNPLNFHTHFDDFDWIAATTDKYVITAPNSGTLARSAADGSKLLFTTGATSGNLVSIQLPAAGFLLEAGKRVWFAARFQVAALSVPSWACGLIQTTTTPGTVTQGIVFEKATAATAITLKHYSTTANLSLTMPATRFAPVAAEDFDIGFYLDEKGVLHGYGATVANGGLFGYSPKAEGNRVALVKEKIPALSSTVLNPTLAVVTNASAATTMTADFIFVAKER